MSTSFFGGGFFGGEFFSTSAGGERIYCTDIKLLHIAHMGSPFVQFATSDIDTYELDTAHLASPFVACEPAPETPIVVEETVKTGGKDDKRRGKKRIIFKPTGLEERRAKPVIEEGRKTVEQRVEETRYIDEAIREVADREFAKLDEYQPPIKTMSLAEIDAEIGLLLRKMYRSRDEEELLLLLMLAAQAI
jgi:hypothetical protein